MTGAGSSDYLKMASDKLSEQFNKKKPSTASTARDAVEKLVIAIHERHIFPLHNHAYPYASDISLSLIVGVRCTNGQLALIKTTLTAAILAEQYEVVGSGQDVFRYWANYFFGRYPPVTMQIATLFCLFMLREVKTIAYGCGGGSQVYRVAKDPKAVRTTELYLTDEDILAGFPQSAISLLLAAINAGTTDMSFRSAQGIFNHSVEMLRKTLQNRHQESLRRASPNEPERPSSLSGDVVPGSGS